MKSNEESDSLADRLRRGLGLGRVSEALEKQEKAASDLLAKTGELQQSVELLTGKITANQLSVSNLAGQVSDVVSGQEDLLAKLGRESTRIDQALEQTHAATERLSEIESISEKMDDLLGRIGGVRDELSKNQASLEERFSQLAADMADVEKRAGNSATGVRDQLIKDRTTFQEQMRDLAADLAKLDRQTNNATTGVRDQLIKDRTTFQEHLKKLTSDLDKLERNRSGEPSRNVDKLREELTTLSADLAKADKKVDVATQSVRDQLIKDRTTFQEHLKKLTSDLDKLERIKSGEPSSNVDKLRGELTTFSADLAKADKKVDVATQSVRDQLIKDRTTFQEQLKGLKAELAEVEKKSGNAATGVRDQLITDRTFARDTLKKFQDQLTDIRKEVNNAQAANVKLIKESTEGIDDLRLQSEAIVKQMEADRPVFNRLKDSWLHPDYYYKNIVGLQEDRQRFLDKAISLLKPNSHVLDVGPGTCWAMDAFKAAGHDPLGVGLSIKSYVSDSVLKRHNVIEADINEYQSKKKFDAIWASHVLEHQPDKRRFVKTLFSLLKTNGWLFILVPPMKAEVVGGHLNLFNTGYLLYTLVEGGFDCSKAMVTKYGYNCVVFVRKKGFKKPELRYDQGDLELLGDYFPFEVTQNFNGLHVEINWNW